MISDAWYTYSIGYLENKTQRGVAKYFATQIHIYTHIYIYIYIGIYTCPMVIGRIRVYKFRVSGVTEPCMSFCSCEGCMAP